MAVERLGGRPIINKREGSDPQSPQPEHPLSSKENKLLPQDSTEIKIFNAESLETKQPFRKTPLMRRIEEQYGGRPIEEILRNLYWDQEKSYREVARSLGIAELTVFKWFHVTGVSTRSFGDAARLVWKRKRESGAMSVVNNLTQIKYKEAREILAIESDEDFKAYLEEIYRQHRSWRATAEELKNRGIYVRAIFVKNWMSHLGIQRINEMRARVKEDYKSFVEKAFSDTDILSRAGLTVREDYVLRQRYLRGGPERTLKDIGKEFNCDRRAIHGSEQNALRKLRTAYQQIEQTDVTMLA